MIDRLLNSLATLVLRFPKRVLGVAAIVVIAAAAYGFTVFGKLAPGGFDDPGAQSSQAAALLRDRFHAADPDVILVVTAADGKGVDDPQVAAAGQDLTSQISKIEGLQGVASYWSLGKAPSLRSTDGTRALVVASTGSALGNADAGQLAIAQKIVDDYTGPRADGVITVSVGGSLAINNDISSTIKKDLARAEAISIPIVMILLILVFGSLVSASLPLLVGLVSIPGSFFALAVIANFTHVSVFSINLITGLGMGLGIDYALLIVNRFREELDGGQSVPDAVRATVRTTGRTIIFSGFTVALALSAMLVFPLYFLRSFAYAGVAVVLLAMIAAVILLPAVLVLLGRKVDALTVLKRSVHPPDEGFFSRLARMIMHRPVAIVVAVSVTTLLVLLGLPFLGAKWGQLDERALPTSALSRQAQTLIRTDFASQESSRSTVVLPNLDPGDPAAAAQLTSYAEALSQVPGVARVDAVTGSYVDGALAAPPTAASAAFAPPGAQGTWLRVVPNDQGTQDQGQELVVALRSVQAPSTVLVGGNAAMIHDTKSVLGQKLPWALGIIAIFTAILLFLFTGSVVVPIKALVLNTLSLSAMFGAMVWIFQDGNLSGFFNFTPTGMLDMSVPILMFCIAFGLSMDYEVFLLSRIKEEYDRTGDNNEAVIYGLQRTGRIITAAAVLLAVVFLAFTTSHVANIQLMGLGIALAVLMDATLVRCLLVPAFMRLAGKWNWWAPAWMTTIYSKIGLSETPEPRPATPDPVPAEIG